MPDNQTIKKDKKYKSTPLEKRFIKIYAFKKYDKIITKARYVLAFVDKNFIKIEQELTTSETYPWSLVTQIFHNGQPYHGGDRKTFEVMTYRNPWFRSFLVCSSPLSRIGTPGL
jgi:hypothetical protein